MSQTTPGSETKTFADFGVADELCAALEDAGITRPFPIQELTLPLGLSGADVIGQARTGTGKTLAFGIPLLHRIDDDNPRTQALVIVPTRELCLQVAQDVDRASARRATRVIPVYGGKAIDAQTSELRKGAPVVVGTPGRLLDLMRRGHLDLSGVTTLVLDEADEMLDLGFLPDVETLIESCATERQTLLFSATMPAPVVALARRYMRKPTFLRAEVEEARIAPETEQHFFSCHRMDKAAVLARVLQTPGRGLCVVFTRTKRMADVLASELRDRGVAAAPIHSDLRQEARERALSRFRKGTIDVLVATEVAARGLDISDVTHVVNYDCPDDEKMYLHRIGRTGRAGERGVAITLAVWNELARLEMIKKALDIDAPTHEVFSTSPILDELFSLPPREGRRPAPVEEQQQEQAEQAPSKGRRARGRRRNRSRSRPGDAAGPTEKARPEKARPTEKAPADERAPAAAEDGEARVRRRTRTRRRVDAGAVERPAAARSVRTGDRQAADSQTGAGTAGETDTSAGRSGRDTSAPAGGDSGSGTRTRARRDTGSGRSRRAKPRKRRTPPAPPRDVSRTRGPGQPALHRPMRVTHLP